ncbi:hypothetical protein AALO_G00199430 [Alosa alosa]|uniref:Uncharacterized protein n=1 Tax=Alosa alosa TaxID=278164 RepID=A0AAV6G261_9TELE|nr:hypothetical protein AALO_G00199430 [Alosa alosa]
MRGENTWILLCGRSPRLDSWQKYAGQDMWHTLCCLKAPLATVAHLVPFSAGSGVTADDYKQKPSCDATEKCGGQTLGNRPFWMRTHRGEWRWRPAEVPTGATLSSDRHDGHFAETQSLLINAPSQRSSQPDTQST